MQEAIEQDIDSLIEFFVSDGFTEKEIIEGILTYTTAKIKLLGLYCSEKSE